MQQSYTRAVFEEFPIRSEFEDGDDWRKSYLTALENNDAYQWLLETISDDHRAAIEFAEALDKYSGSCECCLDILYEYPLFQEKVNEFCRVVCVLGALYALDFENDASWFSPNVLPFFILAEDSVKLSSIKQEVNAIKEATIENRDNSKLADPVKHFHGKKARI